MQAVTLGPLPGEIMDAFSEAWEICKTDSPEYFTLFTGTGSGVKELKPTEIQASNEKEGGS